MEFRELDEFVQRLERAQSKSKSRINKFISASGETLRGIVVHKTPVDTGHLRDSWKRSRAVGGRCEVYNNTEYALHVEYGHRTGGKRKRGGTRKKDETRSQRKPSKHHGFVPGVKMLHRGVLEYKKQYDVQLKELLQRLLDD